MMPVCNPGKVKHSFIDLAALGRESLHSIIDQAIFLKNHPKKRYFDDKCLAMIFGKNSTRTRVSFEVGINQLGGYAVVLDKASSQLGRGESIADTARVMSRYCDAIMFRGERHEDLLELDAFSSIPVINGLTNYSHPCQILTDIFTYQERKGSINGKQVAWVGDGRSNMANSWIEAASIFGFYLNVASPVDFAPKQQAVEGNQFVSHYQDPKLAVKDADLVTTDSWVSMGDLDVELRHKLLAPYQVDKVLFALAKADALFMHCLPAHRGLEVTDEVMDCARSCVFDEAENRLHVQKAIILWCLDLF